MKKRINNKNGITLIALVITIIVLLILAGVALAMLSGENSVLKRSAQAKESTDRAQIIEEAKVEILGNVAGNEGRISETDAKEILGKYFNGVPEDLSELETNMTTKNGGYGVKLKEVLGNTTIAGSAPVEEKLTEDNHPGTIPYKPSESFKKVAETNLDDGLVITDAVDSNGKSTGNEYVWIEVPNNKLEGASSVTNGPDYSSVTSSTDYTNIESALIAYVTSDLLTGTGSDDYNTGRIGWKDEWYDGSGKNASSSSNTNDTTGCGLTSRGYTELYQKMLKSVYENGGFWIGRYEAGTGTARNSGDSASGITPLSKIDQYPINFVTCSEAQAIASNVPNKGSYNSSLMFGIQWDLVLKHLKNKGVTVNELTSDSSSWGNYDLAYNLNQSTAHGYKGVLSLSDYSTLTWSAIESGYSHSAADWSTIAPTALSTGATTRNMKKNIYDLAGNMYEWTLEHATSDSYSPCAVRGGFFYDTGSSSPASYRNGYYTSYSNNGFGLRVSLY